MRRIAIAACLLTLASQAHAQTQLQPPIASPEWLDRLAAQWNAEKGPRAPLPCRASRRTA